MDGGRTAYCALMCVLCFDVASKILHANTLFHTHTHSHTPSIYYIQGRIVGISTTFWAAKDCGIAERLVSHADAVVAADNALADLFADAEFIQRAYDEAASGKKTKEKPCEHLSRVAMLKCKERQRDIWMLPLFFKCNWMCACVRACVHVCVCVPSSTLSILPIVVENAICPGVSFYLQCNWFSYYC